MIIVLAAAVCALSAATASASTTYTGSSSQEKPVWLKASGGVVTWFKIILTEHCRNAAGRPTGAISGRYAYSGRLQRRSFSHALHKRGLLTAQGNQRFDVTISFGGAIHGTRASGSFKGDFRFFTLRGRYVASCTTGGVSWSAQAP